MKYEITKEQILSLYMGGGNEGKFKEWFPEVFETVLEVGKWYKLIPEENNDALVFLTNIKNNECFGFKDNGDFFKKSTLHNFTFNSEPEN